MAAKPKPIRYSLAGPFTVLIQGLATEGMPRQKWVQILTEMGEALQDEIANSFARERVAGSSQLKPNDPDYTARKARQGYDTRRGHRTNTLQSMLRSSASKLFVVQGPFKNGNARIIFKEALLHAVVPYAEYYAAAKVRREGILVLARAWLNKHKAPVEVGQKLALRALAADRGVATRRAAVFGGRAAFIRPTRGLTQATSSALGRQARAGLTPAQLRQIERMIR